MYDSREGWLSLSQGPAVGICRVLCSGSHTDRGIRARDARVYVTGTAVGNHNGVLFVVVEVIPRSTREFSVQIAPSQPGQC